MRTPANFEEAMSVLTAALGTLERIDITPDQLSRLRQAVIRLSNAERRFTREVE